jgi:hypothetical protein
MIGHTIDRGRHLSNRFDPMETAPSTATTDEARNIQRKSRR